MKIFIFFPTALILVVCLGCKKLVTVPPPPTQAPSETVFATDGTALSAALGLYSQMTVSTLSNLNGGITLYAGLSADEIYNTGPSTDLDPFFSNTLTATNTTGLTRLWTQAYKNIYQANAVLEGLSAYATLTDSLRRQLRGEMLFARALNYFYLTALFGDVPLELSTDYRINSTLPRTAANTVWEQVKKDLVEAQGLLSIAYAAANRTRPNKWAATALLARTYLYGKDWGAAETAATAVIGSGLYSLTGLSNVFLINSPETIWQLSKETANTTEGATFIPASATTKPVYALSPFLLNAFEAADGRKTAWLNKNTVGGQTYYYPYKYKVRSNAVVTEYYIVLRLSEMYLLRAEARAAQNNASGALADLNIVRSRAGLAALPASTPTSGLLPAILHERQTELFAEWGHRWLDLIRTGTADAVLGTEKGATWQPADKLYPIPQFDINVNPFLTQNPGY